ncbi:MAG TPA: hypothetical protein VK889_08870 [Solirubrobacterales bacterium]|nr:hypothetical protein [Solirubrobacterales bacterium]
MSRTTVGELLEAAPMAGIYPRFAATQTGWPRVAEGMVAETRGG